MKKENEKPVNLNDFSNEVQREIKRIKTRVRKNKLPISRRIVDDRVVDKLLQETK